MKEEWGDGLKVIKNFFASMYRHQFRAVIAATAKETTYNYIDMADDLIYAYVETPYEIVKKCFLRKCKTTVDQFFSKNGKCSKNALFFEFIW